MAGENEPTTTQGKAVDPASALFGLGYLGETLPAGLIGDPPDGDDLAANDVARMTPLTYADLWQAYVAGAKSGQKHPTADDYWLNRSADGYCKLVHATKDPEHFEAMGKPNALHELPPPCGSECNQDATGG